MPQLSSSSERLDGANHDSLSISDYNRQAEEAISYSHFIQQQTDAKIVDEAYESPWSIIREAVIANPHAPQKALDDGYRLARMSPFDLDVFDRQFLVIYAGRAGLEDSEYELLAQHSHLPIPRAVGGNPASPVRALQYAEKAFWEPYQTKTLLRHPLIPYDMAYRQVKKSTPQGWHYRSTGLDAHTLAGLLLREDWTMDQRTDMFRLIFQHLTFSLQYSHHGTSDRFFVYERIINLIAEGPDFPDEIKILAWHTILPALAELPQPLTASLNGSLPSSCLTFLLGETCPIEILESACLLPYPLLRVTAANHSRCPEHSQVAAALLR